MTELAQMHCSLVKANTPRLNDHAVSQLIAQLPGWQVCEREGESHLEKVFQFKNFSQAIIFTDKVAHVANEEDHHPAILTEWGKVTVSWWTHRIKGLHQNDFIMAAKTDQLYGGVF